jgi:hypothetical protein
MLRQTSEKTTREEGLGVLGRRIFHRHAAMEASGVEPKGMTKFGMHLLQRGEGHMGRGLASWGTRLIERGAGRLAEMAGPAAPILAGLEMLNLAINKNAKIKSDITGQLGQSGIFGGRGSATGKLTTVRSNLNSNPLNLMGLGYEKTWRSPRPSPTEDSGTRTWRKPCMGPAPTDLFPEVLG